MSRHRIALTATAILAGALIVFSTGGVSAAGETDYAEGMKAYKAGKYASAAEYFYRSIQQGNVSPHAWVYLAHSYSAAGKRDLAMRSYQEIIKRFKGSKAESIAYLSLTKLQAQGVPGSGTLAAASTGTQGGGSSSSGASSGQSAEDANLPAQARVFYRADGPRIMINVRINGRPMEMLFDTGAPGIVVSRDQIKQLGLRLPDGNPDGATGGSSNSTLVSFWRMPASVQVGTIKRDGINLFVYETLASHALLGQDFFKAFDYTIDHKAHCIEFRRKGTSHSATASRYAVPFDFRNAGNRIIVQVEVNGKSGPMMLDTGNSSCGIAFSSMAQMKKFGVSLPPDATLSSSVGISGSGSIYRFQVRRVKLGPIDKTNLSASVGLDSDDSEGLPLLGQEMWDGWQYTIDMDKKMINLLRR